MACPYHARGPEAAPSPFSVQYFPTVAATRRGEAALNAMTVGLARELAPAVRVNTISPGMFATDVAKHWSDTQALTAAIPMGRFGQPHEIVGAALYLASDASSYTTGANIAVGGGIESPR